MITFAKTPGADGSYLMELTYTLPEYEDGSEFFHLYPAQPEGVVRETRLLTTPKGRKIQTGITVTNGLGRGVAWPV